MARYIDADKILYKLKYMQEYVYEHIGKIRFNPYNLLLQVGDAVISIPTEDVVPVVRCKNCKYCELSYNKKSYVCERNNIAGSFYIKPDDYCSFAERINEK